jgi:uncharacterized protein YukE
MPMTGPTAQSREGGAGFRAIPSSMDSEAHRLDDAAKALADVSESLQTLPSGTADVFGEDASARAYVEFLARWSRELSTQVGALKELATKLRTSAGTYPADDVVSIGRAAHVQP